MDELAFGGAADGRVAGLPGDPIEVEGEQGGVQAQPGGGDGRFTTGMAGADHDHVEGFGGGGAEAHGFIIGSSSCSAQQLRLSLEQGIEGGVVEGGVDVEAGIEEHQMLVVLNELKGCGCGPLDGVAAVGFEIKDVV